MENRMPVRLLLLSICMLLASAYMLRITKAEPVLIRQSLAALPMQIGPWQGQQEPVDPQSLAALRVDDYVNCIYTGLNRAVVGLYIGYYESQRQGDTMHSPLNCLPGAGWNPVVKGHVTVRVAAGGPETDRQIEVNRIVIQKGIDRQLVLYWYQSHGRVVASEYWGKVYTVLDAMRLNRTDAALVRIVSPIVGLDEAAGMESEHLATDFVRALFPLLDRYLPN